MKTIANANFDKFIGESDKSKFNWQETLNNKFTNKGMHVAGKFVPWPKGTSKQLRNEVKAASAASHIIAAVLYAKEQGIEFSDASTLIDALKSDSKHQKIYKHLVKPMADMDASVNEINRIRRA